MSESHDIEQIKKTVFDELTTDAWDQAEPSVQALARNIAGAVYPLIASAREEGAREMRERAADAIHDHTAGTYDERIAIMRAIRALPLSPPKDQAND